MSEGKHFVRTLHRLGYKSHQKLHGESFDWLFESDEVKDFLQWFCENVNEDNYVSEQQLKEFQAIEESGKAILDGKQLQDAIKDIESTSEDMTDDKLREEIARLQHCKKSTQEKKEKLIQHRNVLSMHHTALSHRLSKMSQVQTSAVQELKKQTERYHADNMEMNSSVDRLGGNVTSMCQLYSQETPTTTASKEVQDYEDANFLCQVSLQRYFAEEEKFTHELTEYTKRQFFKDIGQIAGEPDSSRYSFLDIGSPTTSVLHGGNEDVFRRECKELARLQSEYPASLYRNIKANAQSKSLEAAVRFSEQHLQTLTQNPHPKNESEFRQYLHEVQSKLQHVKRKAAILYESQLPMLVKKMGELQTTRILQGDYDLKISRQDYFTYKQDQVIKQMIVQRTRNEFLTMAFEVEEKNHKQTHRLLTGISTFLERYQSGLQSRMSLMSEPSFSPSKTNRQTIDSRDKFITRLYQILEGPCEDRGDGMQLFLKFTTLVEYAEKLTNQLATLRGSFITSKNSRDDTLALLESTLNACEEKLYSGSATKGGAPQLSPVEISQGIAKLHRHLDLLEETLLDIISNINSKKKTIQFNKLLARERSLFVYFFTNPSKLRRLLAELSARLEAKQMS